MASPVTVEGGRVDTEEFGRVRSLVAGAAVETLTALIHSPLRWIPALIAVVVLLGSPALPATGAAAKVFSCAGWTFVPFADGPYSMVGNARVISAGRTGAQTSIHSCNASLPHGATVTSVSFMLVDFANFAQVENCQLRRQGLLFGYTAGGPGDVLASVPATGDAATPGEVKYTDSTITNGKITNNRYGYVLSCYIDPSGGGPDVPWVGVYGATITYTTA